MPLTHREGGARKACISCLLTHLDRFHLHNSSLRASLLLLLCNSQGSISCTASSDPVRLFGLRPNLLSPWNWKQAPGNLPPSWRLLNRELRGPPTAWEKGKAIDPATYCCIFLQPRYHWSYLVGPLPLRAVVQKGPKVKEMEDTEGVTALWRVANRKF